MQNIKVYIILQVIVTLSLNGCALAETMYKRATFDPKKDIPSRPEPEQKPRSTEKKCITTYYMGSSITDCRSPEKKKLDAEMEEKNRDPKKEAESEKLAYEIGLCKVSVNAVSEAYAMVVYDAKYPNIRALEYALDFRLSQQAFPHSPYHAKKAMEYVVNRLRNASLRSYPTEYLDWATEEYVRKYCYPPGAVEQLEPIF